MYNGEKEPFFYMRYLRHDLLFVVCLIWNDEMVDFVKLFYHYGSTLLSVVGYLLLVSYFFPPGICRTFSVCNVGNKVGKREQIGG